MSARFFCDEPRPASVADKLLENAEQLEIKLFRREGGNVTALVELHATLGADFFADDEDHDEAEQSRRPFEAMPQNHRNGLQRIRRTAATLLERERPGSGTAFLGHRTIDLARKHYLDPLLSAEVVMPSDLPEPPRRITGPREDVE